MSHRTSASSAKPATPATPAKAPPPRAQGAGKGLSGPATVAQSADALPPMPHVRDQSLGQVAPKPDPVIEQAYEDLHAGQVDTDMRATPGLDAARRARMVRTPPPDKDVGSALRH